MLIGNVQINFGVSQLLVLTFSHLVDNRRCWNLTTKLTPIMSSFCVDQQLTWYLENARSSNNYRSDPVFSSRDGLSIQYPSSTDGPAGDITS